MEKLAFGIRQETIFGLADLSGRLSQEIWTKNQAFLEVLVKKPIQKPFKSTPNQGKTR